MQLVLMADHRVGAEITRWLLDHHRDDLALVVAMSRNDIFSAARDAGVDAIVFESAEQVRAHLEKASVRPDIGVLAWWPGIIKEPLLSATTHGFINTHPSLLPYNRGKHYNFWALVEQAPFGVSLHFIDAAVDSGDVVAQEAIAYGWEDTGATLYAKATEATVRLFRDTYPAIRSLRLSRERQDLGRGSLHLAKELEGASIINLDEQYTARDLLNLIRARTFPGYPACSFRDAGGEYEVRIAITRKAP